MSSPTQFLTLVTKDVTDPFYNAEVEIKEQNDTQFTVFSPILNTTRTFLRKDDPQIVSYTFIENPFTSTDDDDLFDFIQTEDEGEQGNHVVKEQLRLEEQFGSYSSMNREQSIFLLQSYTNHPKELVLLSSPNPNTVFEDVKESDSPFSFPSPLQRSSLYVPVLDIDDTIKKVKLGGDSDGDVSDDMNYKNSPWLQLSLRDYANVYQNMEINEKDGTNILTTWLNRPFQFITSADNESRLNTVRQVPPVPCLLYDVKRSSAMTYSQLRIKTCVRADSNTRSKIYDDINIPFFSTPLRVPLTTNAISKAKVQKIVKRVPKQSLLPLLEAPYNYSVYPDVKATQIGIDSNLMQEEYERHYIIPHAIITPHPHNAMDEFVYNNLHMGVDIDTTLVKHIPIKYITPNYNSAYNGYIDMKYVPEPVILTKQQETILEWAITTYPHFKQLVEQYKRTKTPQVWFEHLHELWNMTHITPAKLQNDMLNEIRTLFSYPSSFTLTDIKQDVQKKKREIEEEQRNAERNATICYGLSIRKLYFSLDSFKEDVAHSADQALRWDKDRDTLPSDISRIRSYEPSLLEGEIEEEKVMEAILTQVPFLSKQEAKRRAYEITQKSSHTIMRPGDLVMVRLPNASYIYQKTPEGWVSKTNSFDEQEYCETNTKGYLSLNGSQLTGKEQLNDSCAFIDKKCVPIQVLRWIELLEQIDTIEHKVKEAESIEDTIQDKKEKLDGILLRMLSLSRAYSKLQTSTLSDDAWVKSHANIDATSSSVYEKIQEMYEKARSITDFTTSWLEVENVLDNYTHFDVDSRAFVEIRTRKPIACEHVTNCISAARATKEKAGSFMRAMLNEYGNYDEVGQKAICRLCGEEIGDDVVSEQEGFGSDDAPIQLRSVTEVAVHSDYQELPTPAQSLYKMVLALRDIVGFSIDEAELVRAVHTWYYKFLLSSQKDSIKDFLLQLQNASRETLRSFKTEIVKVRTIEYIKAHPEILRIKNKIQKAKAKKDAKQRSLRQVNAFFSRLSDYTQKIESGRLLDTERSDIESYQKILFVAPIAIRQKMEREANEMIHMAHSIIILIYAIQTSKELTKTGLLSAPGMIGVSQGMLYEADRELLIRYLVYMIAKKNRMREHAKDSLESFVKTLNTIQFSEESIAKSVSDGITRLQSVLSDTISEEQRLITADRVFTPNRNPLSESFRASFASDHPIQSVLEQYAGIENIQFNPDSINPNSWMNYDTKSQEKMGDSKQTLDSSTLAIDISTTRFPLSMPRLESMQEISDAAQLEKDILSFSSQFDLVEGRPRRKLQLRSGGSNIDIDEFTALIREKIPPSLLKGKEEWMSRWIETFVNISGPLNEIVEYDLDSQTLVDTAIKQTDAELQKWKSELSETDYVKKLKSYRDQIRTLISSKQNIKVDSVSEPIYTSIPRISADVLPEWYTKYISFTSQQIEEDTSRLNNFLTQANIEGEQKTASIDMLKPRNKQKYEIEQKQFITSVYYDGLRGGRVLESKRELLGPIAHPLSNGDDFNTLEKVSAYDVSEWNATKKKILDDYLSITENTIEAHSAEVLARQNMERKARADKFTEEESGLQKMYREFNLGRQFVSIDDMGIQSEYEQMDPQLEGQEVIDHEEAIELMMGMGEDEGQYDMGEYDSL